MQQITIGFSKSSATFPIFSWLIILTQKTPYSHVYVKYNDPDLNRVMYYQASHTVVNYMSEAVFLAQETVVQEFTFSVSDESFIAMEQFAADNAGKPYGTLEIIGLGVVQLASLFNIKMHNPLREAGSTWICDQLIAAMLAACNNVKLPMPLDDMTPQDVYAMVKSLPPTLS